MLTINTNLARGMGTIIGFLSLLQHYGKEVTFETDAQGFIILIKLIRIYGLKNIYPVVQEPIENRDWNRLGDLAKMFSPYLSPTNVNLFDKVIPNPTIQHHRKPCIGFSCFTNSNKAFTDKDWLEGDRGFPRNRQYSVDEWAKIFKLIKLAGYDIITLDSMRIDIETKMLLLREQCEAVIGYEGGIGHICHTLNIPFIMLPWKNSVVYNPNIYIPKDEQDWHHFLHLDKRTYFLESLSELLSWNTNKLHDIIDSLKEEKGNNKILKESHILMSRDMERFIINGKARRLVQKAQFRELEESIIRMISTESGTPLCFGGFNPPTIHFVDHIDEV